MGIACIKTQQPSQKDPIFIYQNMINIIKNIDVKSQYQFLQKLGIHQINQYKIQIELIGKGSYSQVYSVRSLKTDKTYAIKKIFKKNNRIQQALMNEFSILKQMDHPNILKMYEMFEDENNYYITTQYCNGKQLFDVIILQKCFKQSIAKQIFFQIITAIKYCHQNHIIHRDLKPQNIVYDNLNKHVKIIDFGSAIISENSQFINRKVIGTSYYIAPEVLKKVYNQKCDIWSLGIILFILLSGQPPFKGKQDNQILANVMNGPLQFKKPVWLVISQNAKDLIKKMLNRNPIKRPSAEQVLKHKWFQVIKNEKQKQMSQISTKRNLTIQLQQSSLTQVLQNMKKFKDIKSSSIQQGILIFIVNFIKNNKNQDIQLLKCFKTLDLNNDGRLSLEELKIGLQTYLKLKSKQAQIISQKIFKKADRNYSGFIDYSEFLVAATNIQLAVSQQNLQTAFNFLDEDQSGALTVSQIRSKLGSNISQQKYQKLIKQFDKNKDGLINKQQFIEMMKMLLKT